MWPEVHKPVVLIPLGKGDIGYRSKNGHYQISFEDDQRIYSHLKILL